MYAYKASYINLFITYEQTVIKLFILTEEKATLYQANVRLNKHIILKFCQIPMYFYKYMLKSSLLCI